MSDHLRLEIAHAVHRGHESRGMPSSMHLAEVMGDCSPALRRFTLGLVCCDSVLSSRAPVPGCACERCTGIAPAVLPVLTASHDWTRTVEYARSVPIVDVLARLGCDPRRKGRTWVATCPLHDDKRPSMSVDTKQGLWYCFPCAEGGDGITLWMRARAVAFGDAVKDLAA